MIYYALSVFLAIAFTYVVKKLFGSQYPEVDGPKGLPVIGNLNFLGHDALTAYMLENCKKWPQMFVVKNLLVSMYVISDAALLKEMCLTRFNDFLNHPDMLKSNDRVLSSKSLVNLQDDKWKDRRKLLGPYFNVVKLNPMVPDFSRYAQELVSRLDNEPDNCILDMRQLMSQITLKILCESAFGVKLDVNAKLIDELNDTISASEKLNVLRFIPYWYLLPLDVVKRYFTGQNKIAKLCTQVINQKKSSDVKQNDLLQALIDSGIDSSDILSEAFLFFLAGYETTATTLSWALFVLSKRPDLEKKIKDEIDTVLNGEAPNSENIHKLLYLESFIDEVLRFYPAALVSSRTNTYPAEIGGKTFPKGTFFAIPIWAIHHNEKYWPNPEAFDPDRFSKENRDKIVPGSYLPFGLGPRMCIGFKFSLLESRAILATLYQKYTFSYDRDMPEVYGGALYRPKELLMKIHRNN